MTVTNTNNIKRVDIVLFFERHASFVTIIIIILSLLLLLLLLLLLFVDVEIEAVPINQLKSTTSQF